MATSARRATRKSLRAFLKYAQANGYRIGESLPYTSVHSVHENHSFHYDKYRSDHDGKVYSEAADINTGAPGASQAEREKLALLIPVAESYGIAFILGIYGTEGSAAKHRDHAHVDIGSWSNYGRGAFPPPRGDSRVYDMQTATRTEVKKRDNLYGKESHKRANAVRMASTYMGPKFPYGVEYAQRVIGVKDDGVWGAKSKEAHKAMVRSIQQVLAVNPDGVWGKTTDAAFLTFVSKYRRF